MFKKPDGYKNVNTSQTKTNMNMNDESYIQKLINYFKYCLDI
jgi:hypothetical protein